LSDDAPRWTLVTVAYAPRTAARPLFRRHVRRPRLTRLLDETAAQAIVLAAPAGYGKTVLAAEWCEGRRVAWYRATAASADLNAFAAGLAAALDRILPGAAGRLAEAESATPQERVELVAPLLEDWPEDAVLAIDDYERVVPSRQAEELVDWLLTLTPVRLLVTTRVRPAWASARRLLYEEVLELGREQLSMTSDEAEAVLDGRPPSLVHAALARAEGWPALIGLAALSAATDAPDAAVADTLYRYFADEVLRRETPQVQQFMLRTSVLPTVDAASVRSVLGLAGAEDAIDRLASAGLLQPAGDGLRFHPLLRDFLRQKLRLEEPEAEPELAVAAAEAAAASGRIEEAFELALDAERTDVAAALAVEHYRTLLTSSRDETLERWLTALGSLVAVHPPLMLARASMMLRRGELAPAAAIARDVAERAAPDEEYASRAWYLTAQALNMLCNHVDALDAAKRARAAARTHRARGARGGRSARALPVRERQHVVRLRPAEPCGSLGAHRLAHPARRRVRRGDAEERRARRRLLAECGARRLRPRRRARRAGGCGRRGLQAPRSARLLSPVPRKRGARTRQPPACTDAAAHG
jgi:LuxR family maltose regulon positive regulatory protein